MKRAMLVFFFIGVFSFFSHLPCFAQEDSLILLGSNDDMQYATGVSARDGNAFVTAPGEGIFVINYSDPSNPYTFTLYPGGASDIEIRDSLLYLASGNLWIMDISNPREPDTIGNFPGNNWIVKLNVFDTLALAMRNSSIEWYFLYIIDVSDPTDPQLLSDIWPPTATIYGGDIYKKGNYIYWVCEGGL